MKNPFVEIACKYASNFKHKRFALFTLALWINLFFVVDVFFVLELIFDVNLDNEIKHTASIVVSVVLSILVVDWVIPRQVTKEDIIAMAKDLQEQMNKIKAENEQLSKQLKGETPNDETFINIVNETIDYLHNSPEEQIVSIRGYLLYIYQGNNEKIKQAIRHLTPNSPKLQQINIYGGNNIVQPNATSGEQNIGEQN